MRVNIGVDDINPACRWPADKGQDAANRVVSVSIWRSPRHPQRSRPPSMTVTVTEEINAPVAAVWNLVTDIDRWTNTISGIVAVEVVERPESGIVGLKWRETRMLFGKEAVETMWISAAEPNRWYEATAINHGAVYSTRISMEERNDKVALTATFSTRPTTIGSRLMSVFAFLFNGTMRKLLQQDLRDIRSAVEET
jgi:hypothetical protein